MTGGEQTREGFFTPLPLTRRGPSVRTGERHLRVEDSPQLITRKETGNSVLQILKSGTEFS